MELICSSDMSEAEIKIENILVPVDGSELSVKAAEVRKCEGNLRTRNTST